MIQEDVNNEAIIKIFQTLQKVNSIKQVRRNKLIKQKIITLNSSLESVRVI